MRPCSLINCINLLQGTTIYHPPKIKDFLSTDKWAEVPWLRILWTQMFRSEKSHFQTFWVWNTLVYSIFWLHFAVTPHTSNILTRWSPKGCCGGRQGLVFLLKLGKMFRNIAYVNSSSRKVWYVNVESHVSYCYSWKTWERTIGSWRHLPGHTREQVKMVQNTRSFPCILLHLTLSSSRSSHCFGSTAITMLTFH